MMRRMADPTALLTAVAAAQTVQLIGMPEAQLTLAHATIYLATAPKSNAVTTALGPAMADIKAGQGRSGAAASAGRALFGRRGAGQCAGL
jgi:replication-associated recombination protein RarA